MPEAFAALQSLQTPYREAFAEILKGTDPYLGFMAETPVSKETVSKEVSDRLKKTSDMADKLQALSVSLKQSSAKNMKIADELQKMADELRAGRIDEKMSNGFWTFLRMCP
jgi:hypothetical protein